MKVSDYMGIVLYSYNEIYQFHESNMLPRIYVANILLLPADENAGERVKEIT